MYHSMRSQKKRENSQRLQVKLVFYLCKHPTTYCDARSWIKINLPTHTCVLVIHSRVWCSAVCFRWVAAVNSTHMQEHTSSSYGTGWAVHKPHQPKEEIYRSAEITVLLGNAITMSGRPTKYTHTHTHTHTRQMETPRLDTFTKGIQKIMGCKKTRRRIYPKAARTNRPARSDSRSWENDYLTKNHNSGPEIE